MYFFLFFSLLRLYLRGILYVNDYLLQQFNTNTLATISDLDADGVLHYSRVENNQFVKSWINGINLNAYLLYY